LPDLSTDTRLRLAAPGDASAIAHVHRESWRTTYAGILPLDVIAAHAGRKSAAEWARRLADGPSHGDVTWVAERGGAVVGFANCGPARHRLEGLEAEIYTLYVLQDHQRRGAGRELVRACARHFVRQGQFGFYLWVLKANRARMFYDAMGGQEIGEKTERLGLHSFAEIAYAWHDLTGLVAEGH
jgi:ribosomal protein S18 acetylase RimI-like enzyme